MNILGSLMLKLGGNMWQPAFDEERESNYDKLKLSEKIGYHLFCIGLNMLKITEKDLVRIANELD